jgi:transposase
MITIGIDPHKASITAVALDERTTQLGELRLPLGQDTVRQLLAFAAGWPARCWAIEGAIGGYGYGLAQRLVAAGERVLNVPTNLSARARLLNSGSHRKTDPIDAASVAVVALHHRGLRQVVLEDQAAVLRLLIEYREDLSGQRTRVVNWLHALLRALRLGGAKRSLTAAQAAHLMEELEPASAVDAAR